MSARCRTRIATDFIEDWLDELEIKSVAATVVMNDMQVRGQEVHRRLFDSMEADVLTAAKLNKLKRILK